MRVQGGIDSGSGDGSGDRSLSRQSIDSSMKFRILGLHASDAINESLRVVVDMSLKIFCGGLS